jgi:hypothetical protein
MPPRAANRADRARWRPMPPPEERWVLTNTLQRLKNWEVIIESMQ